MQSSPQNRLMIIVVISLSIIACSFLRPSNEITSLQSTIEALTSQQDSSQGDLEPTPLRVELFQLTNSTASRILMLSNSIMLLWF
jgi:hypothetical protein